MHAQKPKILIIVGPTSSGKTSLSITLAHTYNGEVISADSRQVYRGLNLGSGKVTSEEMSDVPHHLLDIADPMDVYTASDFQRDGTAAIAHIQKNGHLPIIAGGTFFYIDMLLGRVSTPAVPPNKTLRRKLEQLTTAELFALLTAKDPLRAATVDSQNPRRMIRSLEIIEALGSVPVVESTASYDTLTLGITVPKEELHHNIQVRLLERLNDGMLAEVEGLLAQGVSHTRLEDLGLEYRYLSRHLRGEMTYDQMVEQLEAKIRQFAKRQMSWLKRDSTIVWVTKDDIKNISTIVDTWRNA